MNCGKDTPKCMVTHDYTPLNKCCKDKLFEILNYVTDLFDKNGIKYWLDYGTLLGATRDGKFIPWDRDTDIGILEADKDRLKELVPVIQKAGYYVEWNQFNGRKGCHFKVKYSTTNSLHVCIFIWFEDNGMLRRDKYIGVYNIQTDAKKGKDFPKEWIDTLSKVKFDKRYYSAPGDPEQFCTHRYGEAWKKPLNIADWNNKVDNRTNIVSKYSSTKLDEQLEVTPIIGVPMEEEDAKSRNMIAAVEYGIRMADRLCPGEIVKFKVWGGGLIRTLANNTDKRIWVFDKDKTGPEIENVVYHTGPFSPTVDKWSRRITGNKLSLVHIDCKNYQDTQDVLLAIKRIPTGWLNCILILNNFLGELHTEERRAFVEFCNTNKILYRTLAKTHHRQLILQLW